ncbi:MAG: hypothetical protein DI603_04685 [Roseateles depolymerans]|uniref:DUF2782 domain-containing protein n=1 Tax=Roseateles depolymerans TaxID=76731 RepID=A0A2W5DTF0_9BURK|nr:MAG: hypothetical protein DI603_04685 [Roseateles depolymerans]
MLRSTVLLLAAALAGSVHAEPPPEPKVEHNVAEDDQVRIEELRVRGETKQVTVKNKKLNAPDYEIVMRNAGQASAGGSEKSGSGQRVWRLLKF